MVSLRAACPQRRQRGCHFARCATWRGCAREVGNPPPAPMCDAGCTPFTESPCVGVPAGVSNALGFIDRPCPRAPCRNLFLHGVVICFQVNNDSQLVIQEGCLVDGSTCDAPVFKWGTKHFEGTWSNTCRKGSYQERAPEGSYIRIQVCAADGGCPSCAEIAANPVANTLLSFKVDGVEQVPFLKSVAVAEGGRFECTSVTGRAGTCYGPTGGEVDLDDMLPGAEIVFGPVGVAIAASI